ncbi:MAG: class I SAM-dependent methyltransferase [Acidobacteria bacterium]|nr:class I SAM-dependent methyltransferase [Acidobacteriota bacterium]
MISSRLLTLVRCPDCGGTLTGQPELVCTACGRRCATSAEYLVLHPGVSYAEQTKYLDEALHDDARHEHVSPPLLSAKIRNDMLRQFLSPGPSDTVIDLGCGSGKVLVWNAGTGAYQVGIDVSPYFAREASAEIDLVLGDLRRLPFAAGAFSKGYALDVFEHMSRETLVDVLREAARVLTPDGALFVYSHVRKNSRLARGLKAVNALARWFERRGLMDLSRERLRKSDHLNPLVDIPDLEAMAASAGFRIVRIRYYTPAVGAVVENIVMRLVEHWLSRRASQRAASTGHAIAAAEASRQARSDARAHVDGRGLPYAALRLATWAMKLDVLLFGRVRSGPFFALLAKDGASGEDRRS